MSVSFGGFNSNTATFKTAADLAQLAVNVNSIAAGSDNGYASVQLIGAVTAVYSGSAPAVGYSKLASDGAGVKASDSGREYLVLAVDEAASTVTFLM